MSTLARFYHLMGVDDDFDPSSRFETSWLLPPYLLGAWRALISLFGFTTLSFIFAWRDTHNDDIESRQSFSYLTNLTFWGISFYTLFSAIHTFSYARRGRAFLGRWPKPLQVLHSLFYTTVIVYPFLVTIIYWVWLYSGHWFRTEFNAFTNVSEHAMNSVIAFSEIVLPRTSPPPFLHISFLIMILGLYFGVAYITRATEHFYVYHFLDPRTGSREVVAHLLGMVAITIALFFVIWGLIWARKWVTEKQLKMAKLHPSAAHSTYKDVEMSAWEKSGPEISPSERTMQSAEE